MAATLTLADLQGCGVSVQWTEGVALTRAVAQTLLGEAGVPTRWPELYDIALFPTGEVAVTGGKKTNEPVRRLGQLLQATLAGSEPPVQLRLLIAQATAPAPAFASATEFDEALAFFERPNRTLVLAQLYARADIANRPAEGPVPAPTLDTVAPLPEPEVPKRPSNPRARRRLIVVLGAAAAIACGAFGVYHASMKRPQLWNRTARHAIDFARRGSDLMGNAMANGISTVTERVGLGRLAPLDAVETPVRAATFAPEPVRNRRSSGRLPNAQDAFVVFDLASPPDAAASEDPAAAPAEPIAPVSVVSGDAAAADETIYSADSPGVLPAVVTKPQMPRELPPTINPEELRRLELVVSSKGRVESVKLVGLPRTVKDSMLLSAAKAWQFDPAQKDGKPVRFLKAVWLAPQ